MRPPSKPAILFVHAFLLVCAGILLGLHFSHLAADFPNFSPWMDWSKYTDEGWYGDAAIRHFELGHWYVAGDFNPAVALPVWPLLEAALFRVTGVSLVAVRALTVVVFGCSVVSGWFLLRRWRPAGHTALAASAAALLLAASPFCFVFDRMAILEPMLILLMLLALLLAGRAVEPKGGELAAGGPSLLRQGRALQAAVRRNLVPVLGLGLLLPVMVLTKTTAVFLFPAIAYLLWAAVGYRVAVFLRVGLAAGALAGGIWLTYYLALVRPHFLLDYEYLFSANGYTGMTLENYKSVLLATVQDGTWMGRALYFSGLGAAAVAVLQWRRLRAHPLIPALLLWAGGYTFFLAYHDNLQPRYYLVVAVPLTLLVPAVWDALVLPRVPRLGPVLGGALLLAIVVPGAWEMTQFVRNPQYTLLSAARNLTAYIDAEHRDDPTHPRLLLSISGSDISLMTGLPSICDDFGTLELVDRVNAFRPGWYAAWNAIDDDKMDALTPLYHVERVATFPAMDDPERNLLVLYRLDPTIVTKPEPRKHKPTPRRLKTKVGQQPSVEQLQH